MSHITAVVLTHNEEKVLRRCLESLSFVDEIVVIDDHSTDDTVRIAQKYKAQIYSHALNDNFAQQRDFGLEKAQGEWILFVDADEEMTPDLKEEILNTIKKEERRNKSEDSTSYQLPATSYASYYIKRRDIWWGRMMKYGEVSKVLHQGLIRLVRKDAGKWEGKVHETFVTNRQVGQLKSYLNHYPHPTVKDFLQDINHYSTLRAHELQAKHIPPSLFDIIVFPFVKFIYTYFFKLGFLDGAAGFAYAFFMSFHSFLVRSKLYQYEKLNRS